MKSPDEPPPTKTILALIIALGLIGASVGLTKTNEKANQTQKTCQLNQCLAVQEADVRAQRINQFLAGTPAAGYGNTFVSAGDEFGVDPSLVVAIGALESGWFRYCNGGNCFGIANSAVAYESLSTGIETATKILSQPPYQAFSQEPANIEAIGKKWAADKDWAEKVRWIYEKI